MRFTRKSEAKSRVSIPTYAISRVHSIVGGVCSGVLLLRGSLGAYLHEAAFKCQWQSLHAGASWRHLISALKGENKLHKSGRTVGSRKSTKPK